ncbi:hypothetical protein [Rosistilla oblonga]|uniref:hypothetical protein n=1 Tax=Rosistilla oblonga TaxID=2527990 RepID=UPI003A9691BF
MADEFLIVKRRELFDQVWSAPMTKLAPKYGLSDVGLAKVCKKHKIPKPPVGHWAKLEHGKASPKPELPELNDTDLEEIRFFRAGFEPVAKHVEAVATTPEIVVKDDLRNPHRLVDQAREKLRSETAGYRGLVSVGSQCCLDISVTKKSLSRALRILEALIRYWESVGGCVSAGDPGTRFARDEDGVSISISEQIVRHEKPRRDRYYKEYTYEATGKLTLSIDRWGEGLRKSWSDGKVQRLENVLGNVAVALEKWVLHERERRLDRQCEERQEREAMKTREAKNAFAELESERIKNLEALADDWVRAGQIRDYLADLEGKIASQAIKPIDPESFAKWIPWAKWYADSICPITPTPPRPEIDEPITRINKSIEDLDLTAKTRRGLKQGQVSDSDELAELTKHQLEERCGDRYSNMYCEATRVLEGLGYDISARSRW